MTEPPERVLLDAQAIVQLGFGTSGAFRHLLRDAADQRIELIVPELAVAETISVLARRLQKHRAALKELPSLLRAANVSVELGIEQLQALAEARLRGDLAAAGVTPTAAPNVNADELVRRIIARRKPTKALSYDDKGNERPDQHEGFRDQLLWAHVREAARTGAVAFVTGNTRDFAEPNTVSEGRAELHPQLREDLERDRAESGSSVTIDLFVDVHTLIRERLQDEDVFEDARELLEGGAGSELGRAVATLVNERGATMNEFTPEELVEGNIEDAALSTFVPGDAIVEIEDAYLESGEDEPRTYGISASVSGDGDVDWYVSAPTSGDIEAFGDHVENVDDGGGLLQWTDSVVPVRLSVYGRYAPSKHEWSDVSIDYASMPEAELARRAQLHADEEFRRLQALGLEPSDEEIAAMNDQFEQQHGSSGPLPPFKGRG